MKPKAKATTVAVGVFEDAEYFESANDMLNGDALTGQTLIGFDWLWG